MLEWRNWQTHWTQNPAPFTGHEGSTPSSSTNRPPDSSVLGHCLVQAHPGFAGSSRTKAGSGPRALTGCSGRCAGAKRIVLTAILGLWAAVCAFGSEAWQDSGDAVAKPTLEQGLGEAKPDWLSLSGEFRVRYENRQALGYRKGSNGRLRVGPDASQHRNRNPPKWLRFGFQGQDAPSPGNSRWDCRISGRFATGSMCGRPTPSSGTSDSVVFIDGGSPAPRIR